MVSNGFRELLWNSTFFADLKLERDMISLKSLTHARGYVAGGSIGVATVDS